MRKFFLINTFLVKRLSIPIYIYVIDIALIISLAPGLIIMNLEMSPKVQIQLLIICTLPIYLYKVYIISFYSKNTFNRARQILCLKLDKKFVLRWIYFDLLFNYHTLIIVLSWAIFSIAFIDYNLEIISICLLLGSFFIVAFPLIAFIVISVLGKKRPIISLLHLGLLSLPIVYFFGKDQISFFNFVPLTLFCLVLVHYGISGIFTKSLYLEN